MLKRVSIQNFKSLKDVTLDLQKVNLLIGPNNSGKTNFLKALEYMGKDNTNQQELEYNRLTFRQVLGEKIMIELRYELDGQSKDIKDAFIFNCIVTEQTTIEKSRDFETDGQRKNGSVLHFNPEVLKTVFGKILIYKPDPNKILQPAHFSADEIELNGDCSNLIPFIFYLNTNYKRNYHQIERDLAKCVKDISSFSTPPVKVGDESKLGLKFFGKNDEYYWAEDVSEGVLYFLALLTIINQPNPPKLLLLEEPEKGIHPRRIYEVIQFILGLIDDKDIQVIMTTHSPTVVDMFKYMPESVFIFDKDEEGATQVKNLQKDIIEPETAESEKLGFDPPRYLNGLGEAWTVGFLGGVTPMSKVINYGILCEDKAHRNFLAHYLNQCHPSLFQENEQFGWQIKANNDREVEDALPDATRQGFTKFRLDALFVGRDADSTDDKKIKDLKAKLSALCNEHPKVIFMVPIQCIEHWLLHLKWHKANPSLTKNEPQEHIMRPEAKLKVYGSKLKVEKQLEKANEILIDFDASWLESRSDSFKHFHNQVKIFLSHP